MSGPTVGAAGFPDRGERRLARRVAELEARVAELLRASPAPEQDERGAPTPAVSLWGRDVLAEREELLREAERIAQVGCWAWDINTGARRLVGRAVSRDRS